MEPEWNQKASKWQQQQIVALSNSRGLFLRKGMRWTKRQDSEIISPRGERSWIGEFIQCCLPHKVNVKSHSKLGPLATGGEGRGSRIGHRLVSVWWCFVAHGGPRSNRLTSPGQFLIKPWMESVSHWRAVAKIVALPNSKLFFFSRKRLCIGKLTWRRLCRAGNKRLMWDLTANKSSRQGGGNVWDGAGGTNKLAAES